MKRNPCRECGSESVVFTLGRYGLIGIECSKCGLHSECVFFTNEEAINAWNRFNMEGQKHG